MKRPFATYIFLYACESWTLTAELQKRIRAMEMRCYRKILLISYKDHGTNGEDPAGNRTTRRPPDHHKETQTEVVWTCLTVRQVWPKLSCKAQWKGEEDKADRRKRWKDNIREWTCLEFSKSPMAVENREKWRKLIAKSTIIIITPNLVAKESTVQKI